MKLVSMLDFVLEQDKLIRKNEITPYIFTMNVTDYALFLKQPLTLDMFVPCDDNGNVLQEPITGQFGNEQYEGAEWDVFSKAQNKVLFKNINFFKENVGAEKKCFKIIKEVYKDIESFVDYDDVILTESAVKQIGLL